MNVFNLTGESYDPEALPDVDLGYYLPDDDIEDFLATYLKYSGDTTTSIDEITTEFNIHTTYILFSKLMTTSTVNLGRIFSSKSLKSHTKQQS